jgi:hypothetical protein|tara:strand:- start:224 stop:337 length:114 start_codon:yes stop_codon:yes gene_type:complete
MLFNSAIILANGDHDESDDHVDEEKDDEDNSGSGKNL